MPVTVSSAVRGVATAKPALVRKIVTGFEWAAHISRRPALGLNGDPWFSMSNP